MDVNNTSWQQVGPSAPPLLGVQNVGETRIAFVFAATAPAANAIPLDSDQHGILAPGMVPSTITGLDASGDSMFVRSLGPINGKLFTF